MEYEPGCVSIGKCMSEPGGGPFDVAPAAPASAVPGHPVRLWQMVVPGLKPDCSQLSALMHSEVSPPQAQQMYLTLKLEGVSMKYNNQNAPPYGWRQNQITR